jgi:Uma2 family endonuclease
MGVTAMVQTATQPITLAAFLTLPETKPASEYINGTILQKPMPQGEHSTLQGDLVTAINAAVKPGKRARAYPELRCTFGDRSIVPDIVVFQWDRIPRTETGRVANAFLSPPDWTIEILSPEQGYKKVVKNILHCLQAGTQMGWLIDPAEECVTLYLPDYRIALFDEPAQVLPVPGFATEVQITVGDLFGWLMD